MLKLIAKESVDGVITKGKIYFGSLSWKSEPPKKVEKPDDMKVVVYDDKGLRYSYSSSIFELVEE